MTGEGLRSGMRLRSIACNTEVMLVKVPEGTSVVLSCGGHPMEPVTNPATERSALDPAWTAGTAVGKRYADPEVGIEVLCVKPGEGSLAIDGSPLEPKDSKPLPSSD